MSDAESNLDEISQLPFPAIPRAPRGRTSSDGQHLDGVNAPLTADERNIIQRASVFARDKKFDPPPRDWEWNTQVLQADAVPQRWTSGAFVLTSFYAPFDYGFS